MSYGISKRDNEYARQLLDIDAPKTAFMAIAFSLALRITEGDTEAAKAIVWEEWRTLHANGIVPQKPKRS